MTIKKTPGFYLGVFFITNCYMDQTQAAFYCYFLPKIMRKHFIYNLFTKISINLSINFSINSLF